MYKAFKNNKIIAVNESDKFPCLIFDEVIEDSEHEVTDFVMVGSEYVLNDDEKAIEVKKEQVRAVRNQYLETYIDPKQLVMVWNSLSAEEQELYKDYRQYLLDYPQTEGWWEENPMDFETWKAGQSVIEEME